MLVAAALVPPTPLLVPGASGATPVLGLERAAAVAATTAVRAAGPDVVVVVAPGRAPGHTTGRLRPTLGAAGIDDAWLGWPPRPAYGRGPAVVVDDPAGALGVLLLDRAGWTGPVELATVAEPGTAGAAGAATLADLGSRLAAGRSVALLCVGGLSARRGPQGPLATDPRAAAVDDAVAADLADLGPAARARLAQWPADLAAELAMSAWAPVQALLGAVEAADGAGGATPTVVRHLVGAPLGATYAVMSWRWS